MYLIYSIKYWNIRKGNLFFPPIRCEKEETFALNTKTKDENSLREYFDRKNQNLRKTIPIILLLFSETWKKHFLLGMVFWLKSSTAMKRRLALLSNQSRNALSILLLFEICPLVRKKLF